MLDFNHANLSDTPLSTAINSLIERAEPPIAPACIRRPARLALPHVRPPRAVLAMTQLR